MSHNAICPCSEQCPLQRAMDMIGGKWKLAILCSLGVDGKVRYNELKRKISGMAMDEHGIKCDDGHWMTEEELFSLPEAAVISLFNQIYGRG